MEIEKQDLLKDRLVSASTSTSTSTASQAAHLKNVMEEIAPQNYKITVILQGDLNSTPGTPSLEYLEDGQVSEEALAHAWERLNYFHWGDCAAETAETSYDVEKSLDDAHRDRFTNEIQYHIQGYTGPIDPTFFQHSLSLVNTTKHVGYTNFTVGFKNTLDYIFISKQEDDVNGSHGVQIGPTAPMPTIEEFEEEIATPSSIFPSDHVSIGIDISLI